MPFKIENIPNGFMIKYKLDEYYNSNLKVFLQSIALTNLLNNCSLVATPNEAYYCFSFNAESLCTLRDYLFTPKSNSVIYDENSDSESSSEYSDDNNSNSTIVSENSSIIFNKRKKGSIVNLLSYKEVLLLMGSLSTQLHVLHRKRLSFYTLDLDSILVINDNLFLMMNPDLIMPVNSNGLLTFLSPIKKDNLFICPEIANYKVLPFHCHYSNIYYSFGSLIIYCLFDMQLPLMKKEGITSSSNDNNETIDERVDESVDNSIDESIDDIIARKEEILSRLYGTKLYWFLLRCLEDNGSSRQLYYI